MISLPVGPGQAGAAAGRLSMLRRCRGLGQRQAIGRISAIDSAIRVFQLTESRLSILS
jgi:hypothetical protein